MTPTRRAIAFIDGPKKGQWLHPADFDALRDATRRTNVAGTPPEALVSLDYHPTGKTVTRHVGKGPQGVEQIGTADTYTYRPGRTSR